MKAEEKILANLAEVTAWQAEGMTDDEIANRLSISTATLCRIAKKNSEIAAVLSGAVQRERNAEMAGVCTGLCRKCTGYDKTVVKYYKVKRPLMQPDGQLVLDDAGKQVMIEELERVEEVEHIPPDLDAIKFFLMNQDKDTWQIDPERIRQDTRKPQEEIAPEENSGTTLEALLMAGEA